MNTYILAYHTEYDDTVKMNLVSAETWEEAFKATIPDTPIRKTFSLTEAEALEHGYVVTLRQLIRHADGSYSLQGVL